MSNKGSILDNLVSEAKKEDKKVVVEKNEKEENDSVMGRLLQSANIDFPDSLKYFTPNGRLVYGGGGIMPDVFVPMDSTRFSTYYTELIRKSVLNNFTMTYLDQNRVDLLDKFPTLDDFIKGFDVDDRFYGDFTAFAAEKGVERKEDDEFYYPDEDLKIQIKALIARNLWDTNAYFRVINMLDNELKIALELIEEGKLFSELGLH
ncbi:MAG: hypothetical protein EOM23_00775 [Candidatus Moranbacteria bacterium]|nr:hypothetical protein [Candidatus Moranbacteria bacterium]